MYKIAVCEDNPLDAAALQNILDDYEHHSREDLNVKISLTLSLCWTISPQNTTALKFS